MKLGAHSRQSRGRIRDLAKRASQAGRAAPALRAERARAVPVPSSPKRSRGPKLSGINKRDNIKLGDEAARPSAIAEGAWPADCSRHQRQLRKSTE